MSDAVVDTNVAATANSIALEMFECAAACATALNRLARDGTVIVDDAWAILGEYRRTLSPSGQPGPGDAFYRWLLTNWANPDRVRFVHVAPHPDRGYDAFPDDAALASFDPADRVFAAAALVAGVTVEMWCALDTDWWNHRVALRANAVNVVFLCPDAVEAQSRARR
jgi:hypothetical protein